VWREFRCAGRGERETTMPSPRMSMQSMSAGQNAICSCQIGQNVQGDFVTGQGHVGRRPKRARALCLWGKASHLS